MIGDYALRLRKELYQPAEVTMRVPTGDRVAEGEIVKLEVDPKYSESAMFFEAVRKLSEKVDFPGIDSEATLRDVLERLADRYKLDLMVNEAALREAGQGNWSQQNLASPYPSSTKFRCSFGNARLTGPCPGNSRQVVFAELDQRHHHAARRMVTRGR